MEKNILLSAAAILLVVFGLIMIYLGINARILPPSITGAGFLVIAFVFLSFRKK
ncbi:MAG TPA: hypothetical protein VI548_11130 [Chitinophagaceae bacterium]|nr:hypothetical protein [Chitinophagaceae bacterium]